MTGVSTSIVEVVDDGAIRAEAVFRSPGIRPKESHSGSVAATARLVCDIVMPGHDGLWPHRELLWQFILRTVELRHKGSHLGLIWSILNPLLLLGLYVFIFGFIFKGNFGRDESQIEYALGIFLGLSIVHFVGETISVAPSVIVGNPNFVKKVVFPLAILPVSNVAASLFHVLMSLTLVLLGIAFFGPGLTVQALWLPLILVPIILLSLGV